jgi:general secretion pathway protein L
MHVVAIFNRWIEVLAEVFSACREALRARHTLIVTREHDRFVVRYLEPKRDAIIHSDHTEPDPILGVLSADAPIPGKLARAARHGLVMLELPFDTVVTRRITVPTQARDLLGGIVRNQIERLSPWHAEQAVYGFDADASTVDAATLDVRVLITARNVVEDAREKLAAIGLPIDRVVTRERSAPDKIVALWSQADDTTQDLGPLRRTIMLGIGAVVLTSLALGLWAVTSAAAIRADSEDVAAQLKTLQRRLQPGAQTVAGLPPAERAWSAKETSPSAAIVLEALSRALPEAAHLTELRLDGTTLRIIGLAPDAPSLLPPLAQSGHLTDVHFFAPTTRGADGRLFRFNIEARVAPRPTIAED